jgi:hemerythrin
VDTLEWDPALETGDALVDRQHRDIHDLSNELVHAESSPAEVMSVLDRLVDHVLTHFATEEDLMRREFYPPELTARHIAQHRELTEDVRQKVLEFRSGALTATGPLLEFLRDWIATHVTEHDRGLIEYVRARKGLSSPPGS